MGNTIKSLAGVGALRRACMALASILMCPGLPIADAALLSVPGHPGGWPAGALDGRGLQVRIVVVDAGDRLPIELARAVLRRDGKLAAEAASNAAGVIRFHDVGSGTYVLTAWFVGYKPSVDTVTIDEGHVSFTILLAPSGDTQQEVDVVGRSSQAVSHIDPATGNQVFEAASYHPPPTARMTSLIQENVAGAARAPTGEVHIRGQHGEFTYYVDGIPVPLGVFGGLNEVVDPNVIDRATFITGGFPAEYGGQMSAIIDLNNRVPTGAFHLDVSTYAGSYLVFNGTKPFAPGVDAPSGPSSSNPRDTLGPRVGPFRALNSNGQSLSVSDHVGNLGFYASGMRQETDRRIDTPTPRDFHDHGFDYSVYGKLDYVLSARDYLTANLSFGRTNTQIPYDPSQQIAADVQTTDNAFQALSYFRVLDPESDRESNLFAGCFVREGTLGYSPGEADPPDFEFTDVPGRRFLLGEDRRFTATGFRTTIDRRVSRDLLFKTGLSASITSGRDAFTSRDSLDGPGPSIVTLFSGSDCGAFAEMEWRPYDWTSLEVGVRYDQHIAPDVPLQRQVSPRIRWNIIEDASASAYLYYGRLFMPTNIEGLRSLAATVSTSVTPAVAERDHLFEAVYVRAFPAGLRCKVAAFHKHAEPFTDDATLGSSAIKTPFNIADVTTNGLEASLSFGDPASAFSAYVNSSVIHAVGSGALTGGFQPLGSDGGGTDLDHDQRLSVVLGVNYQPADWFLNAEANYGSGLSNGSPENVAVYGRGLFDFNTPAHTAPAWILNCSGGRTWRVAGDATVGLSLYVTNLFNHLHLLKGAYTTGASWEEPRNVIIRLSVHV